jgi:RNA-binding protein NOB1
MEETQWEDIVLDTSAFIQGEIEPLRRLSKRLWTLPQVLQEVKDKKAKQSASFGLDVIPEGIKQAQPSKESIDFVINFARKTGDVQALSKTDILVLALTHEIRQRNEGSSQKSFETLLSGVREIVHDDGETSDDESTSQASSIKPVSNSSVVQPGRSWASVIRPSQSASHEDETVAENPVPVQAVKTEEKQQKSESVVAQSKKVMWDDDDFAIDEKKSAGNAATAPIDSPQDWPGLPQPKPKPSNAWAKPLAVKTEPTAAPAEDRLTKSSAEVTEKESSQPAPVHVARRDPLVSRILSTGFTQSTSSSAVDDGDVDLDWAKPGSSSTGWTHVSTTKPNTKDINKPVVSTSSTTSSAPACSVACSTADFACQNVLLQLKLGVVTLDGRRVTQVRNWVHKCDTCLRIFPIKGKRLFCSACGHPSLSRLAYSIDFNGNRRYHYSKSRRMRTQGNVFPIGKNADLLLREDQLLSGKWAQRMQMKNNSASMFGEDVNDAMGVDLKASSTIRVGHGSQNPNSRRGRERRGAKKKNNKE